uniref:Uncharacterized protein n=1 Tax=Timema cristinae TaxID=61476 RepID=A0A7R9GW48_TIMCR|nr:unnamed protein product [Timema cristinae]
MYSGMIDFAIYTVAYYILPQFSLHTVNLFRFLHNGPAQSFVAPEGVDYERFMASAGEKLALRRKATANSKRFGVDLQKWIDSLTNGFYKVVESCAASTRQTSLCGGVILEPCEGTVWSSLAPDPKSQICTVNNITGRMDRSLEVRVVDCDHYTTGRVIRQVFVVDDDHYINGQGARDQLDDSEGGKWTRQRKM